MCCPSSPFWHHHCRAIHESVRDPFCCDDQRAPTSFCDWATGIALPVSMGSTAGTAAGYFCFQSSSSVSLAVLAGLGGAICCCAVGQISIVMISGTIFVDTEQSHLLSETASQRTQRPLALLDRAREQWRLSQLSASTSTPPRNQQPPAPIAMPQSTPQAVTPIETVILVDPAYQMLTDDQLTEIFKMAQPMTNIKTGKTINKDEVLKLDKEEQKNWYLNLTLTSLLDEYKQLKRSSDGSDAKLQALDNIGALLHNIFDQALLTDDSYFTRPGHIYPRTVLKHPSFDCKDIQSREPISDAVHFPLIAQLIDHLKKDPEIAPILDDSYTSSMGPRRNSFGTM